jgi:cytochrome c peroxidase
MKALCSFLAFCLFAIGMPAAGTHDLKIVFRHLWNGEAVEPPTAPLVTEAGETISITRLSYLLSNPYLFNKEDTDWIHLEGWYGLVNAPETGEVILRNVPEGNYAFLKLSIGVDPETNHSDPSRFGPSHALNTIRNNLHWTWAQGYIFLAMEGHLLASIEGQTDGFSYHVGNDVHLMDLKLPLDLDLSHDTTLVLDFHIDRIFGGQPSLVIASRSSTHSREGDPLAGQLKTRIEQAVEVASVSQTIAGPEEAATSAPISLNGTPYRMELPGGFPVPELPTDYPLTHERVALGKQLFTETLLSRSNTLSCASCHHSENAFTDPRPLSIGEEGRTGRRNAMPVTNMAWKSSFFWDGRSPSLREQALVPIEDHNEFDETLENVVNKLTGHPDYPARFEAAFGDDTITPERIGIAIEQFILTLTSLDSKFDQAVRGTANLSEQEKRGLELFFTEYDPRRGLYGADCFHCHGGPFFSDFAFHNNGLSIEGDDRGRAEVTGKASDNHTFSTPSLRNVELTAPYMHDGRFATLDEVVSHYNDGVVDSATLDPNLKKHPAQGIGLSEEDQQALVAFLKTLTDPAL